MPKRAAWSRSIVERERRAVGLLIRGDVAQLRAALPACRAASAPTVQLVDVGVLQRVLELRAGQPAADVDVLRRLQEQRDALHLRRACGRSRSMIWSPMTSRSSRGFSVMNRRPLFCGLRARRRRSTSRPWRRPGRWRRSRRAPALWRDHVGERDVLRAPRTVPMMKPVSCCGKKPFGMTDEQIAGRATVSQRRRQQRRAVVAQRDSRGCARSRSAARSKAARTAGRASRADALSRPQEARAHHRRQRQRDERRDDDRHRHGDRELAEEPADDAAHEQQRNEHRDQREADRQDREADLARRP